MSLRERNRTRRFGGTGRKTRFQLRLPRAGLSDRAVHEQSCRPVAGGLVDEVEGVVTGVVVGGRSFRSDRSGKVLLVFWNTGCPLGVNQLRGNTGEPMNTSSLMYRYWSARPGCDASAL